MMIATPACDRILQGRGDDAGDGDADEDFEGTIDCEMQRHRWMGERAEHDEDDRDAKEQDGIRDNER